ncbi:hypothetical protein [Hephaestia mangrovi]|uniref:hypothetical protein n=1 Tax=Hephaestia mangrovi TaxID=2873268 RepID=UPI001CA68564|nr:hypothetical protein [Hephaestia mangrovi]MBY8829744.1 hypothetical protein [Hephaestia mangrovi]
MTRPIVAIDPVDTPFNSFVERFSRAIAAAGGDPVPMGWSLGELLRTDMVILHWPTLFMSLTSRKKAFAQLLRFRIARLMRGTRLVWVAHNVAPHEDGARHEIVPDAFVRSLDAIVYLSETSRRLVEQRYPAAKGRAAVVTRHGIYEGGSDSRPFTPPAHDEEVRLLNFGQVRPYKNIEELIDAAAGLSQERLLTTIIGKQLDSDYADALAARATGVASVDCRFGADFLEESDIERALDTAHGAVLPYRAILNSGSAIHALSRHRPVLVPALGSMPELARLVGHDWVQLYDGRLTPERLAAFARHVRRLPAGATPDLSALSWRRVERDLAQLFASSAADRSTRRMAERTA